MVACLLLAQLTCNRYQRRVTNHHPSAPYYLLAGVPIRGHLFGKSMEERSATINFCLENVEPGLEFLRQPHTYGFAIDRPDLCVESAKNYEDPNITSFFMQCIGLQVYFREVTRSLHQKLGNARVAFLNFLASIAYVRDLDLKKGKGPQGPAIETRDDPSQTDIRVPDLELTTSCRDSNQNRVCLKNHGKLTTR